MYTKVIQECEDSELGECLSGIINRIEEACGKYQTDPNLVVPKEIYELRNCLDATWHVASEGLETYLQNTGFSSEDEVVGLATRNIGPGIEDRWKLFIKSNGDDDRLSQFMGMITPEIKVAIIKVFMQIEIDKSDKHKFIKMIAVGQV